MQIPPSINMQTFFSLQDKILVDNKSNFLHNIQNKNDQFNSLHNTFFSPQNKQFIEETLNRFIRNFTNSNDILINFQSSMNKMMLTVYNQNNRLSSNELNNTINALNNIVINNLKPIIKEELMAYNSYMKKFDSVTLPINHPVQSRTFRQLPPKNTYL